ncbi:hypothetical protein [Pseudorhodobacter sp. MZDSW-24AT]|uniref:hypothetical protein n=1 Tax=Pseudorhodobacter sp. MZDSW-24AT TaxID=2052957 RepID=UPI000C1DD52A|nr:hypothetical protein [Pseudorhodobacter sp. MZDSW-24AT]PJF10784.1 hypothetical protein CUR21_02175 [Pseudorhodobacter sp. MZDSW-24AT]
MPEPLRPASEVLLRHGPHAVTLRASLRVAVALETLPGGIAATWDEIARQKLSALYAVIRAGATDRQEAERLLAYAATHPLAQFVHAAQAACLDLLVSVLPPAEGEAAPSDTPSDPMPLARFFAELFSRATSWLHWPPSEVWNASVAEIITALEMQADRELRKAGIPTDTAKGGDLYSKERLQKIEEQGFDPAFDREGLRALKARHT